MTANAKGILKTARESGSVACSLVGVRFVQDSALEEAGFEPSVPGDGEVSGALSYSMSGRRMRARGQAPRLTALSPLGEREKVLPAGRESYVIDVPRLCASVANVRLGSISRVSMDFLATARFVGCDLGDDCRHFWLKSEVLVPHEKTAYSAKIDGGGRNPRAERRQLKPRRSYGLTTPVARAGHGRGLISVV